MNPQITYIHAQQAKHTDFLLPAYTHKRTQLRAFRDRDRDKERDRDDKRRMSEAPKPPQRPIPAAFRRSWLETIRSNIRPLTHLGLSAIILALSLKLSRLQGENWLYYDQLVQARQSLEQAHQSTAEREQVWVAGVFSVCRPFGLFGLADMCGV